MLKFIETVFGPPTLASISHLFDKSTPKVNNQANGAPFPPRDGNPAISDPVLHLRLIAPHRPVRRYPSR